MKRILGLSFLIFAFDQITKFWIVELNDLKMKLAIDVFPPFINLRMAWNEGINFGIGSGLDMRWLLIVVALVITISGNSGNRRVPPPYQPWLRHTLTQNKNSPGHGGTRRQTRHTRNKNIPPRTPGGMK